MRKEFGLIGKKLGHSFSQNYFTKKFQLLNLDAQYSLFELNDIKIFDNLLDKHPNLIGLNVTIPYKSSIIPFLDELSIEAEQIGAVNTILIKDGKKIGYNTDCEGFKQSLSHFFTKDSNYPKKALILGTGGASKAVHYVLKEQNFGDILFVSRNPAPNAISYEQLGEMNIENHTLVVNTTPLGMYPHLDEMPIFPFEQLNANFYVMDLIYNPEKTLFLANCEKQGAKIQNGLEMLHIQAEKAWGIWQDKY